MGPAPRRRRRCVFTAARCGVAAGGLPPLRGHRAHQAGGQARVGTPEAQPADGCAARGGAPPARRGAAAQRPWPRWQARRGGRRRTALRGQYRGARGRGRGRAVPPLWAGERQVAVRGWRGRAGRGGARLLGAKEPERAQVLPADERARRGGPVAPPPRGGAARARGGGLGAAPPDAAHAEAALARLTRRGPPPKLDRRPRRRADARRVSPVPLPAAGPQGPGAGGGRRSPPAAATGVPDRAPPHPHAARPLVR
mmetsp:Transcript_29482/g.94197  ORF Transcript_29482/g.94197 Transcript_29482/m.94197 type:complete len:254 (-) Transcript_29482:93-854(-)